jgi:hypothetical protein
VESISTGLQRKKTLPLCWRQFGHNLNKGKVAGKLTPLDNNKMPSKIIRLVKYMDRINSDIADVLSEQAVRDWQTTE